MKNIPLFLMLLIFFSCKKDPDPGPDIKSNLVSNMPLDAGAYDSISGVTGIASKISPAPNRHGDPNKSVQFNRNDSSFIDFGDLSSASFPNNQFTICCWINVIDTLAPQAVISKRGVAGPWEYSIDNHFNHAVFNLDNWVQDGSTSIFGTDPLKASAPFELNKWHFIAYVADGLVLRVYVDGALQTGTDSHNTNLFFSDTDAHLVIGNGGGYGQNYYFNGCIDDLRIYNKPLDTTAIQYLGSL